MIDFSVETLADNPTEGITGTVKKDIMLLRGAKVDIIFHPVTRQCPSSQCSHIVGVCSMAPFCFASCQERQGNRQ